MKRKPLPPTEFIKACLNYEPDTGRLVWKDRPLEHFVSYKGWKTWNARFTGKEAGAKNYRPNGEKRHIEIGLASGKEKGNRTFNATHIIYTILGIEVPDGWEIDHRDHDEWNNKRDNLRMGTPQQNKFNRVCKKTNQLPKGVYPNGRGYSAIITFNRKRIYLGFFTDPHEAHAAYCKKAVELHGEFACFEHEDVP